MIKQLKRFNAQSFQFFSVAGFTFHLLNVQILFYSFACQLMFQISVCFKFLKNEIYKEEEKFTSLIKL